MHTRNATRHHMHVQGFFFGRTPLIKLSPKKTWEGFLGGSLATLVAAWYLSLLLAQFTWMTCPRTDLTVYGELACPPDPLFTPRTCVGGRSGWGAGEKKLGPGPPPCPRLPNWRHPPLLIQRTRSRPWTALAPPSTQQSFALDPKAKVEPLNTKY